MESLQDKLLEHVVPDQTGVVGKIRYSFTGMKIVHVHWPKVSSVDNMFVATNGALRIQGNYMLQRPGVLGYNKSGEFVFDLGGICLSVKETNAASHHHGASSHHHRDRRHPGSPARDVTCTVGYIKVKFHGGAAMICQFLTSLYIKMYRRHLERQISEVIQETIKDDQQLLLSALTVMAAMNSDHQQPTEHVVATTHEVQHRDHQGRVSRFFYSFRRHSLHTRTEPH